MKTEETKEIFLPYKIVYQAGQGEIVEKKSRFIAAVSPARSEQEAPAFTTAKLAAQRASRSLR